MRFIVQSDDKLDIDREILLEKLERHKIIHDCFRLKMYELKEINLTYTGVEIPIGSISFVTKCLNKLVGFNKENPIELPKYLRTPEFLKRDYNIVSWDKIPRTGEYFLKDASTLKHFTYCGNMEYFIQDDIFEEPKHWFDTSLRLSKDAWYIVSKPVNILSEYRVYVIDKKLVAIAQYDGSPLKLPDTDLICEAIKLINENEEFLNSYTLDVMVTSKGTSLIEVHNFTSCGLYTTVFGDELLLGYRQGIEYLLNDNRPLEV